MLVFALIIASCYTNHAGIAISGVPVALTEKRVTIADSDAAEASRTELPLSIFPEPERRRIAADYAMATGDASVLRLPKDVSAALDGSEKSIKRSERRAEKGLCDKKASRDLIEKTHTAREAYLDKGVDAGLITPEEREALRRSGSRQKTP